MLYSDKKSNLLKRYSTVFFITLLGVSFFYVLELIYFLICKVINPEFYFHSHYYPSLVLIFAFVLTVFVIIIVAFIGIFRRNIGYEGIDKTSFSIALFLTVLFHLMAFYNFRIGIGGLTIDFYDIKNIDYRIIIVNVAILVGLLFALPIVRKISYRLSSPFKRLVIFSIIGYAICVSFQYVLIGIDPNRHIFKGIRSVEFSDKDQPNVLIVVIDNLRADYLGCYGDTLELTPRIDAIASEGALFSVAFSPSSWTAPSFGSMYTSRYPYEIFIFEDRQEVSTGVEGDLFIFPLNKLRPEMASVTSVLQEAGYYVATFQPNYNASLRFNFDQHNDFFLPCYNQTWNSNVLTLIYLGVEKTMKNILGISKYTNSPFTKKTMRYYCALGENLTDYAINLMEKISNQPFLIIINYMDVHEYKVRHPDVALLAELKSVFSEDDYELSYAANTRYCDMQIGRLVDYLSENGRLDDTILIITSDHGEQFKEHGFHYRHGCTVYNEEIRVPLIIRYPPKIDAGIEIDEAVSTIGLLPTVAALADVSINIPDMRGVNLFQENSGNLYACMTLHASPKDALISYPYKLIFNHLDQTYEIYNLQEDPGEKENLMDRQIEIKVALQDSLAAWQELMKDYQMALFQEYDESDQGDNLDFQDLKSIGYIK